MLATDAAVTLVLNPEGPSPQPLPWGRTGRPVQAGEGHSLSHRVHQVLVLPVGRVEGRVVDEELRLHNTGSPPGCHCPRPASTGMAEHRAQAPGTEAWTLPAPEPFSHALSLPPALARPDLPKQRCFSPCFSGSPRFHQTCACFLSAWAQLGEPPPAPPYPGDKPRIVSIDLINDNASYLLSRTPLAPPAPPTHTPA